MSKQCENCGQNVLPGDAICWQCGARLPRRRQSKMAEPAAAANLPPLSLRTIALLGAVLLLLLPLLFFFTGRLAGQPLVRTVPNKPIPPNWQPVTDTAQRFTFNVPPRWEPQPAALPAEPAVVAVLDQLAELGGTETTLVYHGIMEKFIGDEYVPAYLLLAESPALSQLPPEELQQQAAPVFTNPQQLELITGDFDQTRLNVIWTPPPGPLRCQLHLLLPGETAVFFAICTPNESFPPFSSDIQTVLDSYQQLSP